MFIPYDCLFLYWNNPFNLLPANRDWSMPTQTTLIKSSFVDEDHNHPLQLLPWFLRSFIFYAYLTWWRFNTNSWQLLYQNSIEVVDWCFPVYCVVPNHSIQVCKSKISIQGNLVEVCKDGSQRSIDLSINIKLVSSTSYLALKHWIQAFLHVACVSTCLQYRIAHPSNSIKWLLKKICPGCIQSAAPTIVISILYHCMSVKRSYLLCIQIKRISCVEFHPLDL